MMMLNLLPTSSFHDCGTAVNKHVQRQFCLLFCLFCSLSFCRTSSIHSLQRQESPNAALLVYLNEADRAPAVCDILSYSQPNREYEMRYLSIKRGRRYLSGRDADSSILNSVLSIFSAHRRHLMDLMQQLGLT
ncbi:unnamed protein product [Laminaria digitata]